MTNAHLNSAGRSPQKIDLLIGQRIKKLRISRGVTQAELAVRINLTHQQLHKYENGINRLSVGRLIIIARELSASLSEILEDIGAEHEEIYPRLSLELMRDFQRIKNPAQQEALRQLVRALTDNQP